MIFSVDSFGDGQQSLSKLTKLVMNTSMAHSHRNCQHQKSFSFLAMLNERATFTMLYTTNFKKFDWLRAEVFIPTCENYSYYGNQNHEIILSRELRKNDGNISRF